MMRPKVEAMDDFSGSTAVVAVVTPTHVVVANSGDSRAVVGTGKVKGTPSPFGQLFSPTMRILVLACRLRLVSVTTIV